MASTDRINLIFATTEWFDIHARHHNLICVIDPLALFPAMMVSSLRNFLRWDIITSIHDYTFVDFKGIDKTWAEIIGRWSTVSNVRRLVLILELPSSKANAFDWLYAQYIVSEQAKHQDSRLNNLNIVNEIWIKSSGTTCISYVSSDLQLRLWTITQTAPSRHSGWKSTENLYKSPIIWRPVWHRIFGPFSTLAYIVIRQQRERRYRGCLVLKYSERSLPMFCSSTTFKSDWKEMVSRTGL